MPHIHDLFDFVITVFIVHNDKVLLVHHPKYGKWIPMGGHVELDEDPEEALFREVQEETGLEIEILSSKPNLETTDTKFLPTPNYMDVHEANAPHKHIALVYFARASNNQYKLSNEHLDIHWLGEDDLDKQEYGLAPSVKFYCKEAIKAAKSKVT